MAGRVADASVLAAIIFEEPRADEADALLGEHDLYGPTILAYELASIARKKALANPALADRISGALRVGLGWDLRWREVDLVDVLVLALQTGLTTYDASYLYLARLLGAPLVTFDRTLHAAYLST